MANLRQTHTLQTSEASLESRLNTKVRPDGPVSLWGKGEAAKVSLPISVGIFLSDCIRGGKVANGPIRTGLLTCLFAEANHRWPFRHLTHLR